MADQQTPPYAGISVHQLIAQLAALMEATLIKPGEAIIDGPYGKARLWGKELATGMELLHWESQLKKAITIQRTPEQSEPLWSIMLTDSPQLIASDSSDHGDNLKSFSGMAYLYNHRLSMNMLFKNTGHIRMIVIRLKPPIWEYILKDRPEYLEQFISSEHPLFYGFNFSDQTTELFSRLFNSDNDAPEHNWHLLADSIKLCADIFTKLGSRHDKSSTALHQRDADRIYRAQQLLISDFQSPLSVEAICKNVGLGRDRFRQLFKQVYGTTPYQYFQKQRMDEARRLIKHGQHNPMQAGYQVGYSHLGHFAQAFRKQFGYLPKDTKKN